MIKNIFFDICVLYKNFIHWNTSKVLIFGCALILLCFVIAPIVIGVFIYSFVTGVSIHDFLFQFLGSTLGINSAIKVLFYITQFIFFIVFGYAHILLIKLYLAYLNGKRLKYTANYYFRISRIIKYLGLTFLNILLWLIPIVAFVIVLGGVLAFVGDEHLNAMIINFGNAGGGGFSMNTRGVFLLICILCSLYIVYRTGFSYLIFVEDEKERKITTYIKKSLVCTKSYKTLAKFLLTMAVFYPIFLVLSIVSFYAPKQNSHIENYLGFSKLSIEEQKALEKSPNASYYNSLTLAYSQLSEEEFQSLRMKTNILSVVSVVLRFLLLNGGFIMILVSFYKRELRKKGEANI